MLMRGSNIREAQKNHTMTVINNDFTNSPSYKIVKINGVDTDVRIAERSSTLNLNLSQYKLLTFRPESKFNLGSLVEFNDYKWLMIDFTDSDLFPLAAIQKCNEELRWKDETDTLHSIPCVVNKSPMERILIRNSSNDVPIVDQMMYVLVNYEDVATLIKTSQRFILGNQAYRVNGVDDLTFVYNGKGLVQIILKFTESNHADDMENKIADNSHLINNDSSEGTSDGGDPW
jgi:hypothetical protein